jgi:DNA-binding transcriptional MerR regulator
MPMTDRVFLSIGEVLNLLKDEFPDITISKIRFLESQGLLDPERTPSGYRKFYEPDVERLRWILRQQREHFLPLKVIKGKLAADGGRTPAPANGGRQPAAPAPSPAAAPRRPLAPSPTGASFTIEELARASGLPVEDVVELEKYGLVAGRGAAAGTYYDEEALLVANLAAGFMKYGVEPRHLRMYRTSAEREAGFFEQVVMPMLKQRNPEARRQAFDTLDELAGLGEGLREAMLRQALRSYSDRG